MQIDTIPQTYSHPGPQTLREGIQEGQQQGQRPPGNSLTEEDRFEPSEAGVKFLGAEKPGSAQAVEDEGAKVSGSPPGSSEGAQQATSELGVEAEREKTEGEASARPGSDLPEEDQAEVKRLQERDREVRAHEQAHIAAGGRYVQGAAQFEYETGPDGKQYAVGGEVGVDASEVQDDSQATIQKAQVIRRAALAPAHPSAQDHRVAAAASRMEAKARQELITEGEGEGIQKDEAAGPEETPSLGEGDDVSQDSLPGDSGAEASGVSGVGSEGQDGIEGMGEVEQTGSNDSDINSTAPPDVSGPSQITFDQGVTRPGQLVDIYS